VEKAPVKVEPTPKETSRKPKTAKQNPDEVPIEVVKPKEEKMGSEKEKKEGTDKEEDTDKEEGSGGQFSLDW
jgi:hypothetical protein